MKKYILFIIIYSLLISSDLLAQAGKDQTLFIKTNYNQDGTVTLS